MRAALKAHFSKYEAISLIQTFVAYLALDAAIQFQAVISGDFSQDALAALVVAVSRSFLKALWNVIVAGFKKPPET